MHKDVAGDSESKQRELRKLKADLGPVVLAALEDPLTVEVVLNADGCLWQECLGESMREVGRMEPWQAEALIGTVAAILKVTVTRDNPRLEGELPDGSRFAGLLPPIVSAPSFAIRKRASAVFTLGEYVAAGIMTAGQMEVLCDGIRDHRNLIASGPTGSGKTTLLNGLIAEAVRQFPDERFLILEDTTEIQCAAQNALQLRTSESVSMTQLLRSTLRFRPDRILVGEVRGGEAFDLLLAFNTGHEGGFSSLHANNAQAALSRLSMLISTSPGAPRHIEPFIAEVRPVIVHIVRHEGSRKVREIIEVTGYGPNGFQVSQL
jgi:P-type conjugative transfer ATPase TrbB